MAAASLVLFAISALFAQGNGLTMNNATEATVKQIMTVKSEGAEGEPVNVVVSTGTLGVKEEPHFGRHHRNIASEIARLKQSFGVTRQGLPQISSELQTDSQDATGAASQEATDDAAALSSKVSVLRSEPEPVEAASSKSSSWTFSFLLMAVALVVALRTPQGQAVCARLGLVKSQDAWSKMSIDGNGGMFERFMDSPLVSEALAVLGLAGDSGHAQEMQSKPQNVKLVASAVKPSVTAVSWVKPPEPVVNDFSPKKREGFEGFPEEPPMSVSANQTFSALADMLESAGQSEIAGKLRGDAAPTAQDAELEAIDDMGLTMSVDDTAESPEVAALRAALAEDEPATSSEPEEASCSSPAPVSEETRQTFHVQSQLIDTSAESDGEAEL